jgi:hypothetical protein
MRSQREVTRVLELVAIGLNDCDIARRTGMPRGTVRDWRNGKRPHRPSRSECATDGHFPLPAADYAYLLGLYLGDGCLAVTHRPSVWRLRVPLDARYPGIIEECCRAMEAMFPTKRAHQARQRHSACVVVSMYSTHWLCLFPQHGPGRKHHRPIILADWQQDIVDEQHGRFLRGLIHSDGCRVIARERQANRIREAPRYVFSNRSDDIKGLFCASCDALGIRWTRPNYKEVAIYRLASVQRMDQFVGPKR